ncbi:hypothetical protein ACA910_015264 [Epithemia clementina (nom. ined.)]
MCHGLDNFAKVQAHVESLKKWSAQALIDRKALQRTRGFLVYVTLTYSSMTPYFKGLHLTLESWRPDRDEDGWKLSTRAVADHLHETGGDWQGSDNKTSSESNSPPSLVAPVSRFAEYVVALSELTSSELPPKVLVRPRSAAVTAVMFGDASGSGFGTSLWLHGSDKIHATPTAYGLKNTLRGP